MRTFPGALRWTIAAAFCWAAASLPGATDLWRLAQAEQAHHRFSTLFTAQDVDNTLSETGKLDQAVGWCKRTGVVKVYVETFRDGHQARRSVLEQAKNRFIEEGFQVSGCVTPTQVGKKSTGWSPISCYTDAATQARVQEIFEFTASLFDEIMVDDFWFTDCECAACAQARRAKKVTIGDRVSEVPGDTWEDYRCELMTRMSRERVLAPAKRVNPAARLIVKYPQWYDRFHERGYEVIRETRDFDRIWVGTETRDYADARWGGTVQYEAYFIMRWLGGIGGPKCGGGWYDWLGTTEKTYLEQARQTVLGGARESMLFCYGGLQSATGPADVEALRAEIPDLLAVAQEVQARTAVGVAAYKPANSHPEAEARVFDFVGMLGVPLAPCHEFPTNAPAAFFSIHALKDAEFVEKLRAYLAHGRPVLLTDGLAARLEGKLELPSGQTRALAVRGDPKRLLELPQAELDSLRLDLLRPFGVALEAPARVGLYLFEDGSWVVENFRDEPVQARLNREPLTVAGRGWLRRWK